MAQQTTVQKEAQVALTHNKLTASAAKETITEMATAKQTVMNKQLVVDNRNSWIFVGSKEVPNEIIEALKKSSGHVYVHVNREEGTLELINPKKYDDLDWHERMIIYSSILPKIQIESPLVLGFYGDGLVLGGDCASDYAARVAKLESKPKQMGPSQEESATQNVASLLRRVVKKDQVVVLRYPTGERTEIKVVPGTTVDIE